jgi:hypothetical protein
MTIDNWISLASALLSGSLIAIGWIVNGEIQRRKNVAQRRLEFRLTTLESFLPVWLGIQKFGGAHFTQPDYIQQLEDARVKFQLYGMEDEIELMEGFIVAVQTANLPDANAILDQLVPLVRERIRSELGIQPALIVPTLQRGNAAPDAPASRA